VHETVNVEYIGRGLRQLHHHLQYLESG
jgi:hypothetical protein